MDNHNKQGNLPHDAGYYSTDVNNTDIGSDKIIPLDNNDVQVYRSEHGGIDENNNSTQISTTNAALNPFAAALDMWQGYVKSWNNAYNMFLFRNSPMTKGEFWFMYYRFDSKPNEKTDDK